MQYRFGDHQLSRRARDSDFRHAKSAPIPVRNLVRNGPMMVATLLSVLMI